MPKINMDNQEITEEPVTSPFSPMGVTFTPVSKALSKARLTVAGAWLTAATLAVLLAGIALDPHFFYLLVVIAGVTGWLLWLIPRQVRNLQYSAAETDLYIRRGIMFRRLDQVPYGRIQYVEVKEGPLSRYFGISLIQVFTASPQTNASLPGLSRVDAIDLRAVLVERAPSTPAGI